MKPVDLNVLLHFDALMRTASVTRAAERLGISQPAMSGALSRLRQLFGDPLLIRSGQRMVPTERALELHRLFAPLLLQWEQATEPQSFEPHRATRAYTLIATDYIQFLILPPLAAAVAHAAPGIRLAVLPANPIKSLQLVETGQVEVAIGQYGEAPPALRTRALFAEEAACLLRTGHPLLDRPWTRSTFAHARHVRVTSASVGGFAAALAQALAAQALTLHAPITLSSYLAAPHVAARTDLVATVPGSVARALAPTLPLALRPLPLDVAPIRIALYWHERHHADAAHAWLRERIAEVCNPLGGLAPD